MNRNTFFEIVYGKRFEDMTQEERVTHRRTLSYIGCYETDD